MPNGEYEIVEIGIELLEELRRVGMKTFYETFHAFNRREDTDKYLAESFDPARLINEFKAKGSFFYFLYYKNEVAGYLKVNIGPDQTESFGESYFEIERLYILSRFQGLGLGKSLMKKSEELARSMKKKKLWLGVWENNYKAINFYKKLGFEEFSKHIFMVGNDPQTDLLMKKYLD